jgi:HSP20 family protein
MMALVKWTPGTELETLRHEMERLFERTFPKVFGYETEAEHGRWPGLDVRETENAYVVETDLPGMAAEAITVEIEGPYVVVKGERHAEHEATKEGVKRAERAFGKFYRRVALPEGAKAEGAEARYANGVLTVTVPKAEEAKAKVITVEAA